MPLLLSKPTTTVSRETVATATGKKAHGSSSAVLKINVPKAHVETSDNKAATTPEIIPKKKYSIDSICFI